MMGPEKRRPKKAADLPKSVELINQLYTHVARALEGNKGIKGGEQPRCCQLLGSICEMGNGKTTYIDGASEARVPLVGTQQASAPPMWNSQVRQGAALACRLFFCT